MFYGFDSAKQEIQQLWNAKSGNTGHKDSVYPFQEPITGVSNMWSTGYMRPTSLFYVAFQLALWQL